MTSDPLTSSHQIAITGIALRLPEADDPETLRRNLATGRDSVRELSAERRRRTSQPLDAPYLPNGYLEDIDSFDHAFFGIPRGQANLIAPEQRLLLQTAYQALEHAGHAPGSLRGQRVGVYVGGTRIDYASLTQVIEPPLVMGVHHSATAGRISQTLGLTGPAAMIDSSCSSGLVAVQQAVNDLRLSETELAVVSVVNVNLFGDPVVEDPLDLGIRSSDGKTRAFSALADGTGSGEAAISLVLRRLDAAVAAGDPVLAVLRGIAVNNVADRSSSLTAPDSRAEAEVIRLAWQRAGLDPASADYVEAHGTATRLGDPIEVEALGEVFGPSHRQRPLQVSTIKSNIGHTWSASGLAGLVKAVLAVQHGELYPSLHAEQLSPLIDFGNAGIEVTTEHRPWQSNDAPRRAGVSSFGIMGTGAHAVLEQAPHPQHQPATATDREYWLPVSARTSEALAANLRTLREWLDGQQNLDLAAARRTLLTGRDHHRYRGALVFGPDSPRGLGMSQLTAGAAEQPPQLALLLTTQPAPDTGTVAAFRAESAQLDQHYLDAEAAFHAVALPEDRAFCLQYALLRWSGEIGLNPRHIISEGIGRVVRDVVEDRLSLPDGVRLAATISREAPAAADLQARVDKMLAHFADQQLCFLEFGEPSVISAAITERGPENLRIFSAGAGPAAMFTQLYLSGLSWDWRSYAAPGQRLNMPGYQFDKIRCWIRDAELSSAPAPNAAPATGAPVTDTTVSDAPPVSGSPAAASAADQVPSGAPADKSPADSAPQALTKAEALGEVLAAWRDALASAGTAIDAEDDFIGIGGDSISGLQIVNRLASRSGVVLDVLDLFELGTPRALAERLAEELPETETGPELASMSAEQNSAGSRPVALVPGAAVAEPVALHTVPASAAQQNIWLASQFEDGSVAFNLTRSFLLAGPVDESALRRALRRLIERHSAFRTSFTMTEQGLVQLVQPDPAAAADAELTVLTVDRPDQALPGSAAQALDFAARPFELGTAPLLRAQYLCFRDGEQLLTLSTHHLIADGWSLGLIERDLLAFCAAERSGRPAALPTLGGPTAVVAPEDPAAARRRAADREYWLQQFCTVPDPLRLPVAPEEQSGFQGDYRHYELPAQLWPGLQEFAKNASATPFVVALSAMTAVLRSFSSQSELVIGTSLAGRDEPGSQDLVAMLVRTLPLRLRVDDASDFSTLVQHVRSTFFDAVRHSGYEYEALLSDLKEQQQLQRPDLFDVLIEYQKFGLDKSDEAEPSRVEDLTVTPVEMTLQTSVFPLNVMLGETRETLAGAIRFDTSRLSAETVDTLWRSFCNLIEKIIEAPGTPLSAIPFLSDEDALAVRNMGYRTHRFDAGLAIHRQLEQLAASTPERLALSQLGATERPLSFAELNSRANRLARLLRAEHRVGGGDVVALAMDRSIAMVVAVLAVWKCGAAYLPLDPANPTDFIRSILHSAGARLVLTETAHLDVVAQQTGDLAVLPLSQQTGAEHSSADLNLPFDPDDLAYVIYTSGSTGAPKGAMVEHRGMLNHLHAKILDLSLDAQSVVAQSASNSFDISLWQMFSAPFCGGQTVIIPQAVQLDPRGFGEQVELAGLTVLEVVPSYLDAMLDAWQEEDSWPDFATLRWLMVTGEACSPTQINRWFQHYPAIPVVNAYGPTEASDDVTHHIMVTPVETPDVPIGDPIPNTWITVLDDHLRLLPQGAIGEVCVSGVCVGRGYLNAAEQAAKAFVEDPFQPGQRMYRTGDQGFRDREGKLHYLGRNDSQVKVRGFRISLDEIERRILKLPGVRRAALVLKQAGQSSNQSSEHLTAYLVLAAGARLSEVRTMLSQQLASHMVPSQFVQLEQLPLTSNGKTDRKLLAGLADIAADAVEDTPRTETERILLAIEAEVLRRERIGLDQRFFEIGGDSLKAIRVLAKARNRFAVELQLEDFFAHPTIRQFAAHLNSLSPEQAESSPTLVGGPGDYPLAPAQTLLLDIERRYLPAQRAAFNRNDRFEITGPFDVDRFASVIGLLAERHETLRTTFDLRRGLQVIHPVGSIAPEWQQHDLSTEADPQAELERRIRQRLATPFQVEDQSLSRADLFIIAPQHHVLLTSMHQLISDASSARVLHEEWQSCYQDLMLGRTPQLPALDGQYKELAQLRRDRLEQRREQLTEFWRSRLSGAVPRIELDRALPRPAQASLAGGRVVRTLPVPLADQLSSLAGAHGVTEFVVAEAAIGRMLLTETGQREVLFGAYTSGRSEHRSEDQIGCYINTVPLRFPATAETVGALLRRTQQELLEAIRHEDFPYGETLSARGWERGTDSTPLFDVMIAYDTAEAQDRLTTSAGASFETVPLPRYAKEGDLHIAFVRWPERLEVAITYSTDRFTHEAAEELLDRLLESLESLLAESPPSEQLVANVGQSASTVRSLTAEEASRG